MYQFYGRLGDDRSVPRPRYLARLLERRSIRLGRWYRYIRRNRALGQALSFLFGALELAIMESVRAATRIVPLNVEINDVTTAVLPSQQILEIAKRTPIRSLNWCYCYRTYGKKNLADPD